MTTRTWLITGTSSGFGRELASQLLDRGDTLDRLPGRTMTRTGAQGRGLVITP
jgi:NAD(P)-dependent dehydrogenase (short-subunit alcohol dehydrogenase family)